MLLLGSLALLLPMTFGGSVLTTLLANGAVAVLAASCVIGYVTGSAPLVLCLVDTAGIMALALGCRNPMVALGYVFAALWFRSLYLSAARALALCALFAAALVAVLPLWPLIPGHGPYLEATSLVGSIPAMFLTVIVGQQLSVSLSARSRGEKHNAALAELGGRLIGLTDVAEIRSHAWEAIAGIAEATPGMRVLAVTLRPDGTLQTAGASAGFGPLPVAFSKELLTIDAADPARATVVVPDKLNAAAAADLDWTVLPLPQQMGDWLLAGTPKQLSPGTLTALHGAISQVALALRNSAVHAELSVQARTDALTGLANRACFQSTVEDALARPGDGPVTVLFVDLDDFKDINDGLGHAAGDTVLKEVATRLRSVTREQDLCARLGGDEFAVLLRGTVSDAEPIANRLLAAAAEPIALATGCAQVSVSVGIATADDAEAEADLERVVRAADIAMYAAKANGKNRLQIFESGLLAGDQQAAFERQLAAAAGAGQLVVHYQPVLDLADGRCTAAEALVRWQHPEQGLLYPGAFIKAAERTGAIRGIGDFVLRQACADLAGWQARHPERLRVHVNVSAEQLGDERFTETVLATLDEFALPADQLVLEITETVILESQTAVERLDRLASRGVIIAIDDFGTGYSALTTLRALPLNIVKIDTSFIAGVLSNPADQAVIEAIVQMADRLHLRTVAEGVERPDQEELLKALGVDSVQGYLHHRPMPLADFNAWLEQTQPAVHAAVPAGRHAVVPLARERRSARSA